MHYHTTGLLFFTQNARRVVVDVVFRAVPSFQQLRYDEQWVSRLFLTL